VWRAARSAGRPVVVSPLFGETGGDFKASAPYAAFSLLTFGSVAAIKSIF